MKFLTYLSAFFIMAFSLSSCANGDKNAPTDITKNPFYKPSTLIYHAPEFDKIKDADFAPAFDYALQEHVREIDSITHNTAAPSVENTVLALERSGRMLVRAQSVFYNLTSANTNSTLQKLEQQYAPIFAAHRDRIFLNDSLYKRILAVSENVKKEDKISAELVRLIAYYKQQFELAGAALSGQDKEKLKKINGELATLSSQFSAKLLAARKNAAVLIEDAKDLDGLAEDEIAEAAAQAKKSGHAGKYLLVLQNTTQQPQLQNLKNRAVREKLFKASWTRAEKGDTTDTRETIEKLVRLRLQKAQLLGKSSFAEWKLQDQMAKTPAHAQKRLATITTYALKAVAKEAQAIQQMIDKEKGGFTLAPWDWNYYAEKVRKEKYDLDEAQIKPYFELRAVLEKGVFYAAEKLYGITFKPRKDLPVYHPDVVAYEVFDQDGKSMAIYYLDFYARDNKNGGAWMNNFVEQSHDLQQKPVIVNVFNYAKPVAGKPTLLNFDEVTTMFHEFGHTLHGLFANQDYATLSGTNVPRDYVEFPSQINEHWALDPAVLKNYALHYETKNPMPQSLVDKIKKAATFNQGYMTSELMAAASIDMAWHSVTDEKDFLPVLDFEKQALNKYGFENSPVPPRYHTPYFAHIFGGGYSAGYYAYAWSETLDSDVFEWIMAHGGLTRENGDRFRKYILSVGNTIDLNQAYTNFTGKKEPDVRALLRSRGLIEK